MKSEISTLRRALISCTVLASLAVASVSGNQAMSDRERLAWISTVAKAADRCMNIGDHGRVSYYLKAISSVTDGTEEYLHGNKEVIKSIEYSAQRACQ